MRIPLAFSPQRRRALEGAGAWSPTEQKARNGRETVAQAWWRLLPRSVRSAAAAATRLVLDPAQANRAVIWLLLGFALLWTVSASVRNVGLTVHYDMTQTFAYSRELAIGYDRHPPLLDWIVAAYFAVMPVAPWAYFLLASLNTALGLYAVWLAAGYVTDLRRRALAVALLAIIPQFTFLATTFNHNTFQLSLWPLVALAFLASISHPRLLWSVLFGLMSALAMLGKYYAGLIVVGCALAALLHPDRRAYFASWRPYVAALVCAGVMLPNLVWLLSTDLYSIRQPASEFASNDVWTLAVLNARYLGAFMLYLLPALLVGALVLRPALKAVGNLVRPGIPSINAVVLCIAFVPALLPLVTMPFAEIGVRVPWMYPAFFFVPLALVVCSKVLVGRRAVALALVTVAGFSIVATAISPLLMVASFKFDKGSRIVPNHALADTITEIWHCRTGQSLDLVGGSLYTAQSISFYSKDHPSVLQMARPTIPAEVTREQWRDASVVGVCNASDGVCREFMERQLPQAHRIELEVPARFFGLSRGTHAFGLYLRPREDAEDAGVQLEFGPSSPVSARPAPFCREQ